MFPLSHFKVQLMSFQKKESELKGPATGWKDAYWFDKVNGHLLFLKSMGLTFDDRLPKGTIDGTFNNEINLVKFGLNILTLPFLFVCAGLSVSALAFGAEIILIKMSKGRMQNTFQRTR